MEINLKTCTKESICYKKASKTSIHRVNHMNIHEYQAKEILRKFGVPCSPGIAAFTVDEAVAAAKELKPPAICG
jgi:hypothetical protein